MSESAWKWGAYRTGMGKPSDDRRIIYACRAIKRELVYLGYKGIVLDHDLYGSGTRSAVKLFQKANGLGEDGMVGKQTANALWRARIKSLAIPRGWLRALTHWESGDDPGAEFVNTDGSADRGLCQLNSTRKPLTEEEAFDPATALAFTAGYLRSSADSFDDGDCHPDAPGRWRLAVGSWRTPVGARDWCELGTVEPSNDPDSTWAERAAFYAERVDTLGRQGWVG